MGRARRWQRVCAALLAALFLAFLGLHTPPARNAVAALVANRISSRLGVSVTLTQLDYQLWRGEATVGSLRTVGRGLNVTSGRIEIRLAPGAGLELRAFEPRVQVTVARSSGERSGQAERSGEDERPWMAVLQMARIEVVHGAVNVVDGDGQTRLSLDGIDALMTRTPGGAAGNVRIKAAASRAPEGPRVEGVNVDARVEIRSDSGLLVVPAAKLRAGGSAVDVAGELARTSPLALQLRFNGVVESTLVAAALPKQGLRIPGSPAIAVRGRLENDRLIADALEAKMFDGVVTVRGTTDLSDHAGEFTVTARNLDVHEMSTLWSSPVIASRADADLELRMRDWNPESLNGSGTISFRSQRSRGLPIAGATRVGWNGSTLTWNAERLMVREMAVKLDGRLRSDGDIAARYTADIPAVDRLPPLLDDLGIRVSSLPLAGSVSAAGTIEGRVPEVTLTARVTGTDVSWNALHGGVEGDVRVTRSGIEVVSLLARGAELEARAQGLIPLQPRGEWNITGEVQRLDLAGLLAGRGIVMAANASGSFAISGARSSPVVRIERSAGTVAGGTVAVSGSWHPQSGTIEGRVEAAQIDVPHLEPLAPPVGALAATLALTADISGSLAAPAGRAHIALTDTRLRGLELADVTLDLSSDGRELSVAGALGERSILSGQGRVGGPWPLDLKVDLAALPAADLVRTIPVPAGAIADISLAGQANIRLALEDPSAFEYQAEISQLGLRAARDWRAGPFSASGNRDHVVIRDLDLRSGDSRVNVDGGLGFTEQAGTLTVTADAPLADFALLLPGVAAEGQAEVAMRLTGSFASPIVDGRIALRDGSLQASGVRADQIQIEAIAEQSTLTIRNAAGRIGGGEVRVTGALPLGLPSGDRPRQLDFTLRGIDLATFAARAAQAAKLSVPVDLDGRVTLSRLALDAIEGHGALTGMKVTADTERMDLEAPVSWTFERGTLTHTPLRLRGPRSHATLSATLTSAADEMRFAAESAGTVDLSVANPFLADAGVAGGTLTFDAKFTRTADALDDRRHRKRRRRAASCSDPLSSP